MWKMECRLLSDGQNEENISSCHKEMFRSVFAVRRRVDMVLAVGRAIRRRAIIRVIGQQRGILS
jgi:hypothetical protein